MAEYRSTEACVKGDKCVEVGLMKQSNIKVVGYGAAEEKCCMFIHRAAKIRSPGAGLEISIGDNAGVSRLAGHLSGRRRRIRSSRASGQTNKRLACPRTRVEPRNPWENLKKRKSPINISCRNLRGYVERRHLVRYYTLLSLIHIYIYIYLYVCIFVLSI
jgi:hypothetical protein